MQNKWVELFPTIVSMARTIEVISSGVLGSHSSTLQLVRIQLKLNLITITFSLFFNFIFFPSEESRITSKDKIKVSIL